MAVDSEGEHVVVGLVPVVSGGHPHGIRVCEDHFHELLITGKRKSWEEHNENPVLLRHLQHT